MKYIKLFEQHNNTKEINQFFKLGHDLYGNVALRIFKSYNDYKQFLYHKFNIKDINESDYIWIQADQKYLIPIEILNNTEPYIELSVKAEQGWERIKDFKFIDEIINYDYSNFLYDVLIPIGEDELPLNNFKLQSILDKVNPDYRIKFRNYLKKSDIVKTIKKETTSKFEKEEYKGIRLTAENYYGIEFLKEIVDTIEEKFSIYIRNKYVRLLRFGKLQGYTGAEFRTRSKMIKLNKEKVDFNNEYFYDDFIHEYTHAVDMVESLTKKFVPYYTETLRKLYDETGDERLNIQDIDVNHIGFNIPISNREIYTDIFKKELKNIGLPVDTYAIKKPEEFTAKVMEYYFTKDYKKLPDSILHLCKSIHNNFFK